MKVTNDYGVLVVVELFHLQKLSVMEMKLINHRSCVKNMGPTGRAGNV